ncbi:MAG: N-acetylmuramoyl-L-alanine amidase, partial [Pseudomonadota bacterium]
ILAGYIHNALVSKVKNRYNDVRNLGVKHAPLRVLIDAEMPCVIIESAFISNPAEAKMLNSPEHQHLIAQAIVEGIFNFKSGVKAAFLKKSSKAL